MEMRLSSASTLHTGTTVLEKLLSKVQDEIDCIYHTAHAKCVNMILTAKLGSGGGGL